jgi:phage-related protein
VKSRNVPLTELIYEGSTIQIEAVVLENDSCPATEFLASLGDRRQARMEAVFEKFVTLLAMGKHLSKDRFKQIEDTDFYEFLDSDGRILCFFTPGALLLTHGFKKRSQKTPARELSKARSIKKHYEERRAKSHG